jgi:hypothetical protein
METKFRTRVLVALAALSLSPGAKAGPAEDAQSRAKPIRSRGYVCTGCAVLRDGIPGARNEA